MGSLVQMSQGNFAPLVRKNNLFNNPEEGVNKREMCVSN